MFERAQHANMHNISSSRDFTDQNHGNILLVTYCARGISDLLFCLQVDREFLVQKALHSVGFPVPQPLLLCTDAQVIGTEFYLMEHVKASFIASQAILILLVLACALISCRLAQYI